MIDMGAGHDWSATVNQSLRCVGLEPQYKKRVSIYCLCMDDEDAIIHKIYYKDTSSSRARATESIEGLTWCFEPSCPRSYVSTLAKALPVGRAPHDIRTSDKRHS